MAKAVTHAVKTEIDPQFRMPKEQLHVACDDGTVYLFERSLETARASRRWRTVARFGRNGDRSAEPNRLPSNVEDYMDELLAGTDEYYV